MKKTIFAILTLGLVSFGTAAPPTLSKILSENKGQSLPLIPSSTSTTPEIGKWIFLDSNEVDTSTYFYSLVDKPIYSVVDTVGVIHFACKDSTGTDTLAVALFWDGNPQADGKGVWTTIASDTLQNLAAASNAAHGVLTAVTPKMVINTVGYMALRFRFKNVAGSNAARKAACNTPVLNRHQRVQN